MKDKAAKITKKLSTWKTYLSVFVGAAVAIVSVAGNTLGYASTARKG